MELLFFY